MSELPRILHVVFRFATGGLENGVVNLINHLPQYRHAVLALDRCDPEFCQRVQRPDVEFISLHKPPGQTLRMAPAFLREMRRLRPQLVHTRNLAALEMQLPTWWAGGAARVHSEHGWDIDDPQGLSRRHQWMRRAYRPFVQRYIALSAQLESYLVQRVGVPAQRVTRICNGVDSERFHPAARRQALPGSPFNDPALIVVGSVGRMNTVKAQPDLAHAFALALQQRPALREHLRLVLVGEGPLREQCLAVLRKAGVDDLAWLPGERRDVPELMRHLSFFALPSHAEGISNTILEAMACGLPVLATDVGGNGELVLPGATGALVPAAQPAALAQVLGAWAADPQQLPPMAHAARQRVELQFSLRSMVAAYEGVYRSLLAP